MPTMLLLGLSSIVSINGHCLCLFQSFFSIKSVGFHANLFMLGSNLFLHFDEGVLVDEFLRLSLGFTTKYLGYAWTYKKHNVIFSKGWYFFDSFVLLWLYNCNLVFFLYEYNSYSYFLLSLIHVYFFTLYWNLSFFKFYDVPIYFDCYIVKSLPL